jgi:hypothetical protein
VLNELILPLRFLEPMQHGFVPYALFPIPYHQTLTQPRLIQGHLWLNVSRVELNLSYCMLLKQHLQQTGSRLRVLQLVSRPKEILDEPLRLAPPRWSAPDARLETIIHS